MFFVCLVKLVEALAIVYLLYALELFGHVLHSLAIEMIDLVLEYSAYQSIAEQVAFSALKVPEFDLDLFRAFNQGNVVVI